MFEVVMYYVLRFFTSGLGESDQLQTGHTSIVSSGVKAVAVLVLRLVPVLAAVLGRSNRLPRRYRGQLMGWFYVAACPGVLCC